MLRITVFLKISLLMYIIYAVLFNLKGKLCLCSVYRVTKVIDFSVLPRLPQELEITSITLTGERH